MSQRIRQAALGSAGEHIAAEFLQRRGVRIVARNVRRGRGEVDLVAEEEGQRFVVEVKTTDRRTGLDPRENLDDLKLETVRRTAARLSPPVYRVDLVAVVVDQNGADVRWLQDVS